MNNPIVNNRKLKDFENESETLSRLRQIFTIGIVYSVKVKQEYTKKINFATLN